MPRTTTMPATADDPFAGVLGELSDTLASAKGLVPPLQTATNIVADLDAGLIAVGDIDGVLKAVKDVVLLLDGAVGALSPIPVVGEIADALEEGVLQPATDLLGEISQTFDETYQEIVKPAIDVLNDLKTGLADITSVVNEVSITVPQYLNTVEVLSYLLDIAQPLTSVLEGTAPGDRLNTVVETLVTVKNEVGQALAPFADGLSAIEKGVSPFATKLQQVFDKMGSGAKQALDGLESAGKLLKPIANAFHKAIDAFAPVRWALDAIKWVTDHVLKPVVHWILKVTGLQKLVDEAKDKVLNWIGVGPVLKAVQSSVDPKTVQGDGSSVDSQQGSATTTAFEDLGKALGQYRTNRSAALKDASYALVSAITGTPVDPSKSTPLPPWPQPPDLNGNDTAPTAGLAEAFVFGDADPDGRLRALFAAVRSIHSDAASVGSVEPLSLLMLAADADDTPLPPIDPAKWPHSASVVSDVTAAVGQVTALAQAAATLGTSLDGFQTSLALPAEFEAQMAALQTAFKTSDDVVQLLKELDLSFLDQLLVPVDSVLQSQLQDIQDVTASVPKLQGAVQSLSTAAAGVITQMPNADVIHTAVQRMDGWVLGLQQLVAIIEEGYANAKGDTSDLDAEKAQIEASAQALAARLETLVQTVQALTTSIASLQQALDTYSSSLTNLSSHSEAISTKALPSIQHVAVILGKIDSIFDPLSSLLQAENCVDADASQKTWAQTARELMIQTAQTAATPPPASFTALIADFASQALPLGQIETAIQAATSAITTQAVTAFQSNAGTLQSSLQSLTQTLQQTQTYSFTDPKTGKTTETPNDLVDQSFVDQALKTFAA